MALEAPITYNTGGLTLSYYTTVMGEPRHRPDHFASKKGAYSVRNMGWKYQRGKVTMCIAMRSQVETMAN